MDQLLLTCKELPMVIAREATPAWWRPLVGTLAAACVFSIAAVSLAFGQASSRPCPPPSERTDEPRPTCSTGSEKLGRLPDGSVFGTLTFTRREPPPRQRKGRVEPSSSRSERYGCSQLQKRTGSRLPACGSRKSVRYQ